MKKWFMTLDAFEEFVAQRECLKHHTATVRAYVSRRAHYYEVSEYDGKYGKGYTILLPNWRSTRYSYIVYFIKKEV